MGYVKTTMIDQLLNVISPHRCSSCEAIGVLLCESCKYDIMMEPFSGCVLCTVPCGERGICQHCRRIAAIIQAWCVGERREGLKQLIDSYKFHSSRAASTVLTDLLASRVPQLPAETVVVGIPSSPATIRARGFDHIGRIADEFAKQRALKRAYPLVRASSVTLHFLPRSERIKLGPSLFRHSGELVPEKILLLDDIVTTGTTLTAAAKLLKIAGAKEVYVAALARQPEG